MSAFERPRLGGASNTVFKSGPLFISSKGLGWKSWKKRWFILTRTSLVFFKNDPSSFPQRGKDVNLTLGGIDLNNYGSVVVREDKKLLTVLFPDGHDGRTFTLKAETVEDLYEWKAALEQALAQAPSVALVMGHNGIFQTDTSDAVDGTFHLFSAERDKRPVKSSVVGQPILLALEDIDGGPSFLEKALRFLETYGAKVEGILRQSADVEEVKRRVQDYELGKNEFDVDEDAHVVGDCVKHILRELPSSPVPVSCCTALLEAYKIDRKETQVRAMRLAILDAFPEPNRRLLQRILQMMHIIASNSSDNRMSSSAVAACMAPLLLRPLLAGECEFDDDFDMNGDNSAQLLAAANAANNAQAIIATLLEEYENIFDRCSMSADSHIVNSESDDQTDDESVDVKDTGCHNIRNEAAHERPDAQTDDDQDRVLRGKMSESNGYAGSDFYGYTAFGGNESDRSPHANYASSVNSKSFSTPLTFKKSDTELSNQSKPFKGSGSSIDVMESPVLPGEFYQSMGEMMSSVNPGPFIPVIGLESTAEKPIRKRTGSNRKQIVFWGRSAARKSPSVEPIDSSGEEEQTVQRLGITKNDLRHRIAKEARGNAVLQASPERRKQALHECRLALEHDVQRLQAQLQAERDLRAAVEVGLSMSPGQLSSSHRMDPKIKAELEEIALAEADVARLKQKVAELHLQLSLQRPHHFGSLSNASVRRLLQQDFDSTLAFYTYERKLENEESLLRPELSPVRGCMLEAGGRTRHPRKQFVDLGSLSGSNSAESLSHSASMPSTARLAKVLDFPRQTSVAASTLPELTTGLDFFKKWRPQLMEQLHDLDLNYGLGISHDYFHRPSQPSWS